MPSYRFEIAKTGRATCKSTDCKTAQVKIQKGELRFGSFVTTPGFESWSWKHWGCITPAQIENVIKSVDGLEAFEEDPNVLDGYDEVGDENQNKIRTALKEGHVPDDDWKGDPENNRPGARGMKANRAANKKKKAEEQEEKEGGEAEAEASPSEAKPKKNKKAKTAKTEDQAPDVSPPSKKKASRKRKTSVQEAPTSEVPAKKARARKSKPQVPAEESEPEVMPAKKQRGKEAEPVAQVDGGNDDGAAEVKITKRSRTKKSRKEEEEESHEVTTTATAKAAKAAKTADSMPTRKSHARKVEAEEAKEAPETVTESNKSVLPRRRNKKGAKATLPEQPPANVDDAVDAVDGAEERTNDTPAANADVDPDATEPAKEQPGTRRGGGRKVAKA